MAAAAGVTRKMPLNGIKVLELAGLAPVPFTGMILADFGAKVCRVNRTNESFTLDSLSRGKQSICLDLKSSKGQDVLKRLASSSDVIIEPFRPGIMEKLGLGPNKLLELNDRLIYTRLNGKVLDFEGKYSVHLSYSGQFSMFLIKLQAQVIKWKNRYYQNKTQPFPYLSKQKF